MQSIARLPGGSGTDKIGLCANAHSLTCVENEMSDDLQKIIPEPILVIVDDETVEIKQIRVGQISQAMRIAHPFYMKLKESKDGFKKTGSEEAYAFDIYSLVMENADAILSMIALLCDKDEDWVNRLSLENLIALFSAIVEVNLDFFTQRVIPLLSELAMGVVARQKQVAAGDFPSKP